MHEGHAADGRRDREVVCDADLRKIVRNSQIYATYVWTRPYAVDCDWELGHPTATEGHLPPSSAAPARLRILLALCVARTGGPSAQSLTL